MNVPTELQTMLFFSQAFEHRSVYFLPLDASALDLCRGVWGDEPGVQGKHCLARRRLVMLIGIETNPRGGLTNHGSIELP